MTDGYDTVICCNKYIFADGKLQRVALLGYGRKCCYDYFYRAKRTNKQKKILEDWLDNIPYRSLHVGTHLFNNPRLKMIHIDNLVNVGVTNAHSNLNVYYSSFSHILNTLIKNHHISKEQHLEMLLPIGWLNSSEIYAFVLFHWNQYGIPLKNLTMEFVNKANEKYKSLIDTTYPRHYLSSDGSTGLTEDLLSISLHNLQIQIEKANNTQYTQKVIEALSKPVEKGGAYGVCMETANNIIQVAIMTGLVHNTSHAIGSHNSERYGAKQKLKDLNVTTQQKRESLMRNIPSLLDITGQQLSGFLDVLGYEKINFKLYDIHYTNMIYYDYDKKGNIIEIKKKN